jgi:FtsP/CotA-like multicopper oxidase with cupredoxin domain
MPITINQSAPQIVTPRTITSLPTAGGQPYQLLYNGVFPGPTIRVVSQQQDQSTLQIGPDADIDPPPLTQLAISNGLMGQSTNVPFPYFTTHLHGGHTAPEHDGHPDDMLPPMPVQSGGVGSQPPAQGVTPAHIYSYTNDQQPQILWYHDHADMNTSPHVAQGLFAMYIIEEGPDDPNVPYLPQAPYDIPLGLQVQQAGTQSPPPPSQLPLDPKTGQPPVLSGSPTGPNYVVTVNGVDSPGMQVEGRFYRFRVLNASAGQSISLELCDANGNNWNKQVYVIGTDGGMLPAAVNLPQRTIDPFMDGRLDVFQAERYDLLIDFTGLAGQTLYLSAIVRGPNACMQPLSTTDGSQICWDQQSPILAFNVVAPTGSDNTNVSMIGNRSWPSDTMMLQDGHSKSGAFDPTPNRVFTFDHNGQWVISGQPFSPFRLTNGGTSSGGVTTPFPQSINPALIQANSVDLWELENTVACATHPVHVHDIEFQNVTLNGQLLTPDIVAQFGWKDIFVLMPMYSATSCPWAPMNTSPSISFMGNFESHWTKATPPPSPQINDTVPWLLTPADGNWTALTSGTYVFHCHNLGHEDNVMMGQFQVLPPMFTPPSGGAEPRPAMMEEIHGP